MGMDQGLREGGATLSTPQGEIRPLSPPSLQPKHHSNKPLHPAAAAVRSWLIHRRRLHHLFLLLLLLLLPCVTHAATGLSRVSSPLHPSRPFPDPQTGRSLARALAWACFKRKRRHLPLPVCYCVFVCVCVVRVPLYVSACERACDFACILCGGRLNGAESRPEYSELVGGFECLMVPGPLV